MIAVFINCITVILGSLIGLIFARKISEDFGKVIRYGASMVTLVLGIQMAFKYENVIYLVLSLIIGGIVGTWLNIDEKIFLIGKALERRFYNSKKQKLEDKNDSSQPSFAFAFLNASVLFCVGAMAIIGSFQAGVEGDYKTILTKSVLDGFMAIVFAASMGVGTIFSAISIFIYQGLLTIASGFLKDFVSQYMLAELTGVGGALIMMIGLNLLDITKLKTANYLPSMLVIVIFVIINPYIMKLVQLLGF